MDDSNQRQFVKHNFYKVDPLWRRLSQEERADGKREFAAVVEERTSHMLIRSYSLVGFRERLRFPALARRRFTGRSPGGGNQTLGHRPRPAPHPTSLVPWHDPPLRVRRQASSHRTEGLRSRGRPG